jgi:hypothetical protein
MLILSGKQRGSPVFLGRRAVSVFSSQMQRIPLAPASKGAHMRLPQLDHTTLEGDQLALYEDMKAGIHKTSPASPPSTARTT